MTTSMPDDSLDFSRSGPGPGATVCARCGQPITGSYWAAGPHALCETCSTLLRDEKGGIVLGTGRFSRALLFGFGGMLLGAVIWYAVAKLLDLEIGIIAIALGYLVGRAVYRGSGNRGGRRYQILAVLLTYLGIGVAYTPFAVQGVLEAGRGADSVQTATATPAAPGPDSPIADSGIVTPSQAATSHLPASAHLLVAAGLVLLGVLSLPVIALAGGFPGSLISLLIYVIAFAQAWKLTRERRLAITGPFQLGPGSAAAG